MIDQLKKLVRENATDTVINNPEIPDEKNDAVVNEIAANVSDGLKEQADKGNMQSLMDMFNNSDESSINNNPAVSGIIGKVTSSLSSKFGISPQVAQNIASKALPHIMSRFVNKAKDPNDNDFDLQDIVKNIGGGKAEDLLGKITGGSGGLGKMFGG